MGFSAGAELAAPGGGAVRDVRQDEQRPDDPLAGISSRPDFVGIIYPGPSPFARARPPADSRTTCRRRFWPARGSGDAGHAVWADEYFAAMLARGIPNLEMHIYGNGHVRQPTAD